MEEIYLGKTVFQRLLFAVSLFETPPGVGVNCFLASGEHFVTHWPQRGIRMTDGDAPGSRSDSQLSLGASLVHALLDRQQVPRHRRATLVSEVLGLGYTQAHRRLTSGAPWVVDDIARIAEHFGHAFDAGGLQRLVSGEGANTSARSQPEGSVPALLSMDGQQLPCEVWLGEAFTPDGTDILVAELASSGQMQAWVVRTVHSMRLASGPSGPLLRRVQRLLLQPERPHRFRAVLVALDSGAAQPLIGVLNQADIASNMVDEHHVRQIISENHFDAFLIDWEFSKRHKHDLVASVRAQDGLCPIVLIAGESTVMQDDEALIADVMKCWRAVFVERPLRTKIVAAALLQSLQHATIASKKT